jgi:hypothetical protein
MRARYLLPAVLLAAATARADPPASFEPPYDTSFRIIDMPPIQPGQSLEGWTGWRVPRGQAAVDPFGGPNEAPAVILAPQTIIRRPILASGEPVVWTVTRIRTAGGDTQMGDLPSRPLAAAVAFDAEDGLYALDGDGSGGGTPVPLGIGLSGGASWRTLAIRHSYTRQRYDVYVDGTIRAARLGFRDHVAEHHGLLQGTDNAEARLSQISITTTTPEGIPYLLGDVTTNGIVTVADLVRLINALNGASLALQQDVNADLDENGAVTSDDRDRLIDLLLGIAAP